MNTSGSDGLFWYTSSRTSLVEKFVPLSAEKDTIPQASFRQKEYRPWMSRNDTATRPLTVCSPTGFPARPHRGRMQQPGLPPQTGRVGVPRTPFPPLPPPALSPPNPTGAGFGAPGSPHRGGGWEFADPASRPSHAATFIGHRFQFNV